jgi:PKD repeat protein
MKSYAWTYGDGAKANAAPAAKVTHDYTGKGTYNEVVTLTVVDKNGLTGSLTQTINIVNAK